ncbi:MAG TPA: four-carbon acid sugar kinase family protein, partial [Anaerolineales bacterium]|nr:four-carbon acid sugar kinase family protein [Anaerolineales bacterium]
MKMGVVADDVTGSNDIGIMFAKSDYLTHIYSFEDASSFAVSMENLSAPDILILDTNSRLDPPDVAYNKVFAATRMLQQAGCRQFHNKTCSVFRGNIGAEFDAMLDALGLDFAVVVLGFPKNGRTTVDGIHYVHGKKLEDSEFRRDPIHPMQRSDLVGILQSQTKRKVALLAHDVVDRGAEALRDEIQRMRTQCQYLILDVTDQSALATIARAVHDEPVLCGSSAIAEELPAVWGP